MPYEQWVVNNILLPLGMTSSGFNITQDIANRMPTIPGYGNTTWPKISNLGWSNPAGQMYSTANDLATFMMNLFHDTDEAVFLRNTVRESFTPQWNDFSGATGFGLPYEMYYIDNLWVMTKGGDLPGFDSISLYIQELKLGITMLTSVGYPSVPLNNIVAIPAVSIMAEAIKSVIAASQAVVFSPPPPELIPWVFGCYTQLVLSEQVTIFISLNDTTGELMVGSSQGGPTSGLSYSYISNLGYEFQIGMFPPALGCFADEIDAFEGQYLVFQPQGDNNYVIFLPTLIGMDIQIPKCQ